MEYIINDKNELLLQKRSLVIKIVGGIKLEEKLICKITDKDIEKKI